MSKNKENVWEFYDIISTHLNRLKGKLYNVIEASSDNKERCEAQKGLIKGFCNEAYKTLVDDIESFLRRTGMELECDIEGGFPPHSANPLESIERGSAEE